MSAIVTDVETISRLVSEAVEVAIGSKLPDLIREALLKDYLTQEEVRDLTKWSNRKLSYLRTAEQIEFVALGRTYLYPTRAFLQFLDARRIRVARDKVPTWPQSQYGVDHSREVWGNSRVQP